MNNILFKFGKLKGASQLLTSSLFIAFVATASTNIVAQFPIASLLAQTKPANPTNPNPTNSNPANSNQASPKPVESNLTNNAAQRLIGQWQVKDPSSPATITFIFTSEGKFFILPPVDSDKRIAYEFGYKINPTAKPMHLDVKIPNAKQPSLTIFEFTPDGKLRVELDGVSPGDPRPEKFSPDTLVFEKISNATTLPANTQVLTEPNNENQASTTDKKTPEDEGKSNIGAMNRAQQAYFLEKNQFASQIAELGIGIKPDTENFLYKIVPQGNQKQSVMITAQAKRPGLRSYTGAVFVVQEKGELLTLAGICETNEPSTKPPVMPVTPKSVSDPLTCPAGSRAVRRG
jgi:hypothetical protein